MAEQEVITSEKPKVAPEQLIVHDTSEYSMLFDSAKFNQAWRVATAFAQSGLVPDHFKDNIPGVFVVLHMATRMNLDPFMVLQKTYMVHGRPGMEAQLVIALVNARGPFTGPIQWRFEGEGKDRKCTAFATHSKTGEICEATVTWAMVEAEGWNKDSTTRTGKIQKSKWNTLESLMFQYRSSTFLARLYCPEVIMGLSTADELEDSIITLDSGIKVSPKPRTALPEPPEVDPAALDNFYEAVKAQEINHATGNALIDFIDQIAKVNKQTVETVKTQAGTEANFPIFWQSFLSWHKPERERKSRSDKGTKRASEPPPEAPAPEGASSPAPAPENAAEGGTEAQEGLGVASEGQIQEIKKLCAMAGVGYASIKEQAKVVDFDELNHEQAELIITDLNHLIEATNK